MRATPTRRKLEPTHSVPAGMSAAATSTATGHSGRRSTQHGGGVTGGDPVIKGEINWSVSQLRSLFNQQTNNGQNGQHSPNGGSSSSTSSSTNGGGQYQQQLRLQQQQQQQQVLDD